MSPFLNLSAWHNYWRRKDNIVHLEYGDCKMSISSTTQQQPNLARELFWDWRYSEIDWKKSYRSIIERVLERGTNEEWEELIHFYGEPIILAALKVDIKFLPDYTIEAVCKYFNLQKEELACYARKQLRRGQWI